MVERGRITCSARHSQEQQMGQYLLPSIAPLQPSLRYDYTDHFSLQRQRWQRLALFHDAHPRTPRPNSHLVQFAPSFESDLAAPKGWQKQNFTKSTPGLRT